MRQDVLDLYNDSHEFVVYAANRGGKTRRYAFEHQQEMLLNGHFITVGLDQDDGYLVRLVVDEPLTEQEESEWVGKVEWGLHLPDGKLALEGGFSSDDDVDFLISDDILKIIDVPPGDYNLTIYTYFPFFSAESCIKSLDTTEGFGAWFRRTRPDTPVPEWLQMWLAETPEEDPGHETEWDDFAESGAYSELLEIFGSEFDYIHFLVHLSPCKDALILPKIDKQLVPEGVFAPQTGARKPEKCPLGLKVSLPTQTSFNPEDITQAEKDVYAQKYEIVTGIDELLAELTDETETEELLIELANENERIREKAASLMLKRGEAALPMLIMGLKTPNTTRVFAILDILGKMNPDPVIDAMIPLLKDRHNYGSMPVITMAESVLENLGTERAKAILAKHRKNRR